MTNQKKGPNAGPTAIESNSNEAMMNTTPDPSGYQDNPNPIEASLCLSNNQGYLKIKTDNIPAELTQCDQWVVWKAEEKNGKLTKVPYCVHNLNHAKTNDSNTWGTFDQAVDLYDQGGYSGIGFVLTKHDPYVAGDIDNCIVDGDLSTQSHEIISQVDTYTEISPSGAGIRFICKAVNLPKGLKNPRLELYSSGRYVTITGHIIDDIGATAIEERYVEVKQLYKKYSSSINQGKSPVVSDHGKLTKDDKKIISKILKSNQRFKFNELYNGHIDDYPSPSEADLALCCILAFWCQKDTSQIDRLFRSSKLFREKWDEKHGDQTYGELTIAKAVASCSEVYTGQPSFEQISEEWPQVISFDSYELPSASSEDFKGSIFDFSFALARATETDPLLSISVTLGTISVACQGKFKVNPEEGYYEPVNIWTIAALESGNRKSSVFKEATISILSWEKNVKDALEDKVKEAQIKQKNQEVKVKSLRNKLAKAKPQDQLKIEMEILFIESNEIEIPKAEQKWTDDVTSEQLGSLMAENEGRMAILSSEGGIFDMMAGRYSNGIPNIDIYLKGHAGDALRIERRSLPPVLIDEPSLTMVLSPQPAVLESLASKPGFRGRGLLARPLYLLPPSPLGYRKLEPKPIPSEIRHNYEQTITKLLDYKAQKDPSGSILPEILTLSNEAYTEWKQYQHSVEYSMRGGEDFEYIRDWAGKLPGQIARLSGLLHCVDQANAKNKDNVIPLETMQTAINLGKIFSKHSLAVFDLMGSDHGIDSAKYLLKRIIKEQFTTFSKRELFEHVKGKYKRVDAMTSGLTILQERGMIRKVDQESKIGRPSEIYEVNPDIAAH